MLQLTKFKEPVKEYKIFKRKYLKYSQKTDVISLLSQKEKTKDLFLSRIIKEDVKDVIILEFWNFHVVATKSSTVHKNVFKKIKYITQKLANGLNKWS